MICCDSINEWMSEWIHETWFVFYFNFVSFLKIHLFIFRNDGFSISLCTNCLEPFAINFHSLSASRRLKITINMARYPRVAERGLVCRNRCNFPRFSCQKKMKSLRQMCKILRQRWLLIFQSKNTRKWSQKLVIDYYSLAVSRFPRILLWSTAVLKAMFSLQDQGIFKFCVYIEWRPRMEGVRRPFKNLPLCRFDIKPA